jgi:uncharacterized membrane protein YbhN (UPF0104 family)
MRIIQFALAAGVLYYLVTTIQFSELAATLSSARPGFIVLAVLLLVPNLGLQFLKWRLIVRKQNTEVGNFRILTSLFIGFSLGIATPARLGEFGGRAFSIPGTRPSVLIGLTALDKYFSLLVTLSLGALGLCLFLSISDGAAVIPILAVSAAVATVIAVTVSALLNPQFFLRKLAKWQHRWKFVERLCAMLEAIAVFRTRDFVALLALSILFYATFVGQFCALLAAFGPIDIGNALIGVSSVMFAKTVIPPVTLGELGIREGASVFFLSRLGFLKAAAFNASFMLFVINILMPSLIGVVFFGHFYVNGKQKP